MAAVHQAKDFTRARKSLEKWLDDFDAGQRQASTTRVLLFVHSFAVGEAEKIKGLSLEACGHEHGCPFPAAVVENIEISTCLP